MAAKATNFILIIGVIIKVIFATLSERKVKGSKQRRVGPNTVGYKGLQQPICDGLKLIFKEAQIPNHANGFFAFIFISSPYLFFGVSLLNWFIIPLDSDLAISEVPGGGVLLTIALSEISILGILYAGYSSNSKYSQLGSLRAIAQMISYSITISLSLIIILLTIGTIDYLTIISSQANTPLLFALFPIAICLILSLIAELGRPPKDLLEADQEIVAGHKTEYSGVKFAFFFLAEYSMMLFKGVQTTVLLLGFSNPLPFLFLLFWIRASLPRLRIDHILNLGWSNLLPFLTGYIIFLPGFLIF